MTATCNRISVLRWRGISISLRYIFWSRYICFFFMGVELISCCCHFIFSSFFAFVSKSVSCNLIEVKKIFVWYVRIMTEMKVCKLIWSTWTAMLGPRKKKTWIICYPFRHWKIGQVWVGNNHTNHITVVVDDLRSYKKMLLLSYLQREACGAANKLEEMHYFAPSLVGPVVNWLSWLLQVDVIIITHCTCSQTANQGEACGHFASWKMLLWK